MMMSALPGGAAALVAPATAGRGEVGGLRQSIDKFRGTDTLAALTIRSCFLVRARAAPFGQRFDPAAPARSYGVSVATTRSKPLAEGHSLVIFGTSRARTRGAAIGAAGRRRFLF